MEYVALLMRVKKHKQMPAREKVLARQSQARKKKLNSSEE